MKFYHSDPFAQSKEILEQEEADLRLNQKLEKLFTPKPFAKRWKTTNTAGIVLSYLCNILSGLTAFTIITFLIFQGFKPTLGFLPSIVAAALLSVSVTATSEVIKRHSLNNFLRNLIQFKRFSFPLFTLVLSACSLSVLASFYGARQIPQIASAQSQTQQGESSEEIRNLEEEIAKLEKEKEEYFENNKKPNSFGGYRLSSKYMPTYNAMLTDLSTLRKTKTEAEKKDGEEEAKSQKQEEKNNTELSKVLGFCALGVELIFVLSILGNWLYYWNSYKERLSSEPQKEQDENRPEGENNSDENRQGTEDENRQRNRTCENCGKNYTHKHHKQKYCTDDCRKEAWKERNS